MMVIKVALLFLIWLAKCKGEDNLLCQNPLPKPQKLFDAQIKRYSAVYPFTGYENFPFQQLNPFVQPKDHQQNRNNYQDLLMRLPDKSACDQNPAKGPSKNPDDAELETIKKFMAKFSPATMYPRSYITKDEVEDNRADLEIFRKFMSNFSTPTANPMGNFIPNQFENFLQSKINAEGPIKSPSDSKFVSPTYAIYSLSQTPKPINEVDSDAILLDVKEKSKSTETQIVSKEKINREDVTEHTEDEEANILNRSTKNGVNSNGYVVLPDLRNPFDLHTTSKKLSAFPDNRQTHAQLHINMPMYSKFPENELFSELNDHKYAEVTDNRQVSSDSLENSSNYSEVPKVDRAKYELHANKHPHTTELLDNRRSHSELHDTSSDSAFPLHTHTDKSLGLLENLWTHSELHDDQDNKATAVKRPQSELTLTENVLKNLKNNHNLKEDGAIILHESVDEEASEGIHQSSKEKVSEPKNYDYIDFRRAGTGPNAHFTHFGNKTHDVKCFLCDSKNNANCEWPNKYTNTVICRGNSPACYYKEIKNVFTDSVTVFRGCGAQRACDRYLHPVGSLLERCIICSSELCNGAFKLTTHAVLYLLLVVVVTIFR